MTSTDTHIRDTQRKRYIFIVHSLAGIGGIQFYVGYKTLRLREKGWSVEAACADPDTGIRIEALRTLSIVHEPRMAISMHAQSERELLEVVRRIAGGDSGHGEEAQTIVESTSLPLALWGEQVAHRLHGRHVVYVATELASRRTLSRSMRRFLEFKLAQRLLFGITDSTIPDLLPGADGDATMLNAAGNAMNPADGRELAELADIRKERSRGEKVRTILTIGRFEKGIAGAVVGAGAEFCLRHPGQRLNIILVGDTADSRLRRRTLSRAEPVAGLRLYPLGTLYPIPAEVFRLADMFIGNAGSALIARDYGMPVMTVDASDLQGIGILAGGAPVAGLPGTLRTVRRGAGERPIPLADVIEACPERDASGGMPPGLPEQDFSRHEAILESAFSSPAEYYPTRKVWRRPSREILHALVRRMAGRRLYHRLREAAAGGHTRD